MTSVDPLAAMAEEPLVQFPVTEGEYETVYQIGNVTMADHRQATVILIAMLSGDGSTAKVFSMLVKATKTPVAVKVWKPKGSPQLQAECDACRKSTLRRRQPTWPTSRYCSYDYRDERVQFHFNLSVRTS